jgi:hypothetical protein
VILAVLGAAGCETTDPSGGRPGRASAPSAPVRRLDAWRDAEMLAAREGGRSAAVGGGESMAPIYGDNTLLVVAKVSYGSLETGMTVAYMNARGVRVVHRLVENTRSGWRVQGVNNDAADRDRVTPENFVGVVYASLNAEAASGPLTIPARRP